MEKDLDVLMAAHRIARDRRAAGLPVWAHRADIRQFLDSEDESDENAIKVGKSIATELRSRLPAAWFDAKLDDFKDELDDIVWRFENDIKRDDEHSACTILNWVLRDLYDWADLEGRVWLG
jgi:hypothetical protein